MLRSRNSGVRAKVANADKNPKGVKIMTLFEYYDRQIPDYYEGMHRDGFEPWQILHAAHRKIKKAYYAQREAEEAAS